MKWRRTKFHKYVLGAFRHIRDEKRKKDINELIAWILIARNGFSRIAFLFPIPIPGKLIQLLWAYILCLPPLGWSVALLGNMDADVVFTSSIAQSTWACLGYGSIGFGFGKHLVEEKHNPSSPCTFVKLGGMYIGYILVKHRNHGVYAENFCM